jgi:hypothetical protein
MAWNGLQAEDEKGQSTDAESNEFEHCWQEKEELIACKIEYG